MMRVGWIGTGVMGVHMCRHLMGKGFEMSVYNRTAEKALPLVEAGAKLRSSPKEVAENSDVVFVIVGFPADVREVISGPQGILNGLKTGGIIVDHTTSEPSLAREIFEAAKQRGVASLDAPVSGGDIGARNGKLSIMCGGETSTFDAVKPLMEAYGANIQLLGGAGAGQHTKMVNQIVIANTLLGVIEGLLYGHKAGLDLEKVIQMVGSGAAASWQLNNLGPRIVGRNFDPGFFVEHFVKDMGIALEECRRMNLSLPGLSMVHSFYQAVKAQGHGRLGTHALAMALEKFNQTEIGNPNSR
eukprot:GILI01008073.1.p2 GENE.GILI01008073.1~~GILI01008073.1.p2  ORF type:complete len:300 (-),score=93.15 GILI01008073.1:1294-2193(-)